MNLTNKINDEIEFSFSRSSGAGGQNINKVNSKATLRWNIRESLVFAKRIIFRFEQKYGRYVYSGVVIIDSQRYRSQVMNKEDCLEKLNQMLVNSSKEPKRRKKTKPPRKSIEKRINNKKLNSLKKRNRTEKHH